jgi:hypothetical protein
MHFHQGFMPVGKEHQPELAHDQVKASIGEWELLSRAGAPFNRETLPLRRCTSHAEHVWIEIEASDHSLRPNTWSDAPGDNPCPARYIQDMLTRLHIRRPDQVI